MNLFMAQDRNDEVHLVDYISPRGRKYTICGVIYDKKDIINFFALDAALPNLCKICYEQYLMYLETESFRALKNNAALVIEVKGQERDTYTTPIENTYWYLNDRHSTLIKKYQDQVSLIRSGKLSRKK